MNRRYYRNGVGSKIFTACNAVFMVLFTLCMVYPFINQMAVSLNDGADAARGGIFLIPRKFSVEAYEYVFENDALMHGALISVLRVVVGLASGLFCTSLLAYVVTVRTFSGRRFMRVLFIITMYFGGGLIPFYILILKLRLNNTFTVYWLPQIFSVYNMLIIASYMQDIPEAVSESARIDGASEMRIFLRIILPMSLPVMACIAVFIGVFQWNSWFDVQLFITKRNLENMQIILNRLLNEMQNTQDIMNAQLLHQKFMSVSSITVRAATTMVVTIPIVIIYPFFQKYFVGGLTIGAVKG